MTSTEPNRHEPVPLTPHTPTGAVSVARSSWGEQIASAVLRLRGRMSQLPADDPDIARELGAAEHIVTAAPHGWHVLRRLGEWWSGRRIETAWTHVREAELFLVDRAVGDGRFLQSNLDHTAVDAGTLPVDNPARVAFETYVKSRMTDPVPAMQGVLEASFRNRNAYHGAARALRNRLVVVSVAVLIIAAGLVFVQAIVTQAALLPKPKDDHTSRWVTMLVVMLFGALGALITTIPVMARLPRVASPYNFPLQQSLMKISVGMLTGLVGVLVIGAPAATGGLKSFGALISAAIVFGAGQQAVTHFLDTRAEAVVEAMPSLTSRTTAQVAGER